MGSQFLCLSFQLASPPCNTWPLPHRSPNAYLLARPAAPTAGPTSGGVTLTAQLFGGLTNVTYAGNSLELLPGNVKWSALVENWCVL